MSSRALHSKTVRVAYGVLAWCAVGLAFAGVWIPGLPVTVFAIAASYLFSRSSPKFEAWLMSNRWIGPGLRGFREEGGMSRQAKTAALASMWISTAVSSPILAGVSSLALMSLLAMSAAGTLAIAYGVRTVAGRSPASAAELASSE